MYVDVQRPDEGTIEPDYVIWINKVYLCLQETIGTTVDHVLLSKAIKEAKPYGLPGWCFQMDLPQPRRSLSSAVRLRYMLTLCDT